MVQAGESKPDERRTSMRAQDKKRKTAQGLREKKLVLEMVDYNRGYEAGLKAGFEDGASSICTGAINEAVPDPTADSLLKYGSGATRRSGTTCYSLVPKEGLDAIADRFTYGAPIHGKWNWTQDMPIDIIIDHAVAHLYHLKSSKTDIWGDIGAIGWSACALAWYYVNRQAHFMKVYDRYDHKA